MAEIPVLCSHLTPIQCNFTQYQKELLSVVLIAPFVHLRIQPLSIYNKV